MQPVNDKRLVLGLHRGIIKATVSPVDDWLNHVDRVLFESEKLDGFSGLASIDLKSKRVELYPLASRHLNSRLLRELAERLN